jgi:glycosyltransferase involved in cell wall biosynthesis
MSKVKVLHLHTLPVISGSGINTFLVMEGLDKDVYEVELATAPGGALIDEALKSNINVHPIKHFVQAISPYNDIMALGEVIRLLRKNSYTIVHTHNSKAGFIGRLAAALSRVPVVVHTIHGFSFHDFERPPRRALFSFLEKIAAGWADKLITISEPLKEWGQREGIGKPEQYITIYSGIEIDKFRVTIDIEEKRRQLGIPSGHKVVGVVSKLWEGKGHISILQAAKGIIERVPEVSFLIVGEGYLEKQLKELTEQLGLKDHVIFTGFRTDVPEVTATFDVAVLASFFEGMGRVLLEAMVLGKPVVATRVGGIVDVVDEGINGMLVPPGDVGALAEAISRLLLDESLRQKMGEAAKEKIDARFSASNMVKKIDRIYRELLIKKGISFTKK